MSKVPIIGFDAKRIVKNATGLGNYGRTLINDLSTLPLELRLYAPDEGQESLRKIINNCRNIQFRYAKPSSMPFNKALWRSHGIIKDLKRDGIQLYHGLSGELPIGIRGSGIRSVVTIHDLIFLRHPEYYHWIDANIYAWKFHQAVRQADHIIAISECTRRDILEYASIDPNRVSVIYQSFSPRFSHSDTLPSPFPYRYILSVGTIEARKNTLLALKALQELPADLHLVLVGRHTSYADRLNSYAEANGLLERLTLLHHVTDEQLPALYAHAEAFVYPSRYEGFGIPILEAISMGLPVVACTGSCLEEAGGPDCLYVDPDDAQALAHAIIQQLPGAEGREQRIQRSIAYIQRFRGTNVASQIADLYQQLLYNRHLS